MEAVQHIESVPGKCGGKPCIADTRIRVWDIHVWHNLRGQSPEQIVAAFPQLSLADVYAALACTLVAKHDDLEIFDRAFRAFRTTRA